MTLSIKVKFMDAVPHSQWFHSMTNIELYKENHNLAFFANYHRFEIFTFQVSWPELGKGHAIQHWQWRHSKYMTSYLMAIVMFHFSSNCQNSDLKLDFKNLRQGHWVQHSHWSHSMVNIDHYKTYNWAFFASSHRFRDIHI